MESIENRRPEDVDQWLMDMHHKHYDELILAARRFTRQNLQLAEDLTQDTFALLCEKQRNEVSCI